MYTEIDPSPTPKTEELPNAEIAVVDTILLEPRCILHVGSNKLPIIS